MEEVSLEEKINVHEKKKSKGLRRGILSTVAGALAVVTYAYVGSLCFKDNSPYLGSGVLAMGGILTLVNANSAVYYFKYFSANKKKVEEYREQLGE